MPQAAERLAPGGWLLIEVSPMIEPAAAKFLAAQAGLQIAPTIKDLAGLARIVQATGHGLQATEGREAADMPDL